MSDFVSTHPLSMIQKVPWNLPNRIKKILFGMRLNKKKQVLYLNIALTKIEKTTSPTEETTPTKDTAPTKEKVKEKEKVSFSENI
jgi:hypothetical protein